MADHAPAPDAAEDADLLAAWAAGDQRAFAALYARYREPLYGFLVRQLRHQHDAEEVFQELWISVVRRADSYDASQASVRTWLYTIARNRVVDLVRRQQVRAVVASDEDKVAVADDPGADIEAEVQADQREARLRRLLDGLPPGQRDAFLLREQAGLPFAEIAAVLGIGVEAARSRVRDAMRNLARAIRQEEVTP